MTVLLCLLLLAATYFDWHPATTATIAASAILALTLDTREAILTRRAHP